LMDLLHRSIGVSLLAFFCLAVCVQGPDEKLDSLDLFGLDGHVQRSVLEPWSAIIDRMRLARLGNHGLGSISVLWLLIIGSRLDQRLQPLQVAFTSRIPNSGEYIFEEVLAIVNHRRLSF